VVQLSLSVLVDQRCVLLLDLSIVFLHSIHVVDHQACLGPHSENLDVLNVFGDIRREVRLQSV